MNPDIQRRTFLQSAGLAALAAWAPDEAARRRVLVENPQALYGFDGAG